MDSQKLLRLYSVLFLAVLAGAVVLDAGDRLLTFEDLMKFRQIQDASISENGAWIAYALVPDRGDGEAVVQSTASDALFRIERGEEPVISSDGLWVAAAITPTLEEREKAMTKEDEKGVEKNDDDEPKKGMSVLDLRDGAEQRVEKVEAFAFSDSGRWLAFKHYEEKAKPEEGSEKEPGEETEEEAIALDERLLLEAYNDLEKRDALYSIAPSGGELHRLKKYPNKLEYSIKMKEFFDHWLKGEPAPAWMTDGVPYRGK